MLNSPAPTGRPYDKSQSPFILEAVITFPEIDAQHPEHKLILGVLPPVLVVKVKDSPISYATKKILKSLTG